MRCGPPRERVFCRQRLSVPETPGTTFASGHFFLGRFGNLSYLYPEVTEKRTHIVNTIDLIVCVVTVLAVWNGWRRGFIVQVCSLAGIVAGIWLASRWGAEVGAWLRLDDGIAAVGGFVVVLLGVVLAVAVAARLVRRLCRFAGFGLPDILLGVAVAMVKYFLVLSVLFSAFDTLNEDYGLAGPRTIEGSKSYEPVMHLADAVFPFLEWVGERVPQKEE